MAETDWQKEYERAVASLKEAVQLIHEQALASTVVACGWHPFEGVGYEIHKELLGYLRSGQLPGPITQDEVWAVAESLGALPDWKPIFRPRELTHDI